MTEHPCNIVHCTLIVVVAHLVLGSTLARAVDPQDFFDQFLGKERPADKRALAKIKITANEERKLGSQAAQAYLAELKRQKIIVVSRGKDVRYLQRLVEMIRPSMRNGNRYRSIKVYVANSPRTDARSFPGGTLIFFRGILDFAGSEAALVGVIGHELSHLDHGHQLNHLRRMKLAQQTFIGTNKDFDPRQLMSSGMMLMRMFARPFHPEDEAAADQDGVAWAYQAGYDPREMAALFLRLSERDKNRPRAMPALFRTHPFHIDRYKAIQQKYKKLQSQQPDDNLYIGKPNLRQRVTRAEREFEE